MCCLRPSKCPSQCTLWTFAALCLHLECTSSWIFHSCKLLAYRQIGFCLQTVDFGDSGPIRCSSCKAYMSPHMQFLDRGRKFKCCFCGALTPTPVEYICNTGVDGRRHDANDRPELCRGSVDFIASQEYMVSQAVISSLYLHVCTNLLCCFCALKISVLDDCPCLHVPADNLSAPCH